MIKYKGYELKPVEGCQFVGYSLYIEKQEFLAVDLETEDCLGKNKCLEAAKLRIDHYLNNPNHEDYKDIKNELNR